MAKPGTNQSVIRDLDNLAAPAIRTTTETVYSNRVLQYIGACLNYRIQG